MFILLAPEAKSNTKTLGVDYPFLYDDDEKTNKPLLVLIFITSHLRRCSQIFLFFAGLETQFPCTSDESIFVLSIWYNFNFARIDTQWHTRTQSIQCDIKTVHKMRDIFKKKRIYRSLQQWHVLLSHFWNERKFMKFASINMFIENIQIANIFFFIISRHYAFYLFEKICILKIWILFVRFVLLFFTFREWIQLLPWTQSWSAL